MKRLRASLAPYRKAITAGALLFLFGGLYVSAQRLEIVPSQLNWTPVLLVLLVLAPAGLVLATINLQLLGRALGRRLTFREAFLATVYGRIAEILPLPGTIIARGAALLKAGAGVQEGATVMMWGALLTLSMAGLFAAAPLLVITPLVGWPALAVSAAMLIASIYWFYGNGGAGAAAANFAIRLANLALGVLRFIACFASIGMPVSLLSASAFLISSSLTTMIGIVPAGLGLAELIGAGLALLVDIPPYAAFLAVAINRLTGLIMSGFFAAILLIGSSFRKGVGEEHG